MLQPRRLMIAVLVVSLLAALLTGCAAEPRGPAVGFKSTWTLDPGRTYRTTFDGGATYGATKSPRPVLVNVWYPAVPSDGPRMTHAGYLDIESDDPKLAPLATKLKAYEEDVIAKEWIGSTREKATKDGLAALDRALARQTPLVRNAAPAPGRHPLVIYHAGAGSSFEDNALLCERLASEGFVVIGCPFLAPDGASLNIDGEHAGREVEYLLRLASAMENVDMSHVAMVGHSAGAQGALIYGAKAGIALDAIVSLDTTQDYRTVADPRWPALLLNLSRGAKVYSTPTMFVAGPHAMFALADTLTHSDRIYLTIPTLTHNEFIFQGEVTASLDAELKPDPELAERAKEVSGRAARLRDLVVIYLRATLQNDRTARAKLESLQSNPIETAEHTEFVGADTDPLAQAGAHMGPPTPRSVYIAYAKAGADGAIAEMSRAERLNPDLFDASVAFQLLYDLAATGRPEQVPALFDFFLARGMDPRPVLVSLCEFFASLKRYPEFVEGCVRLGRLIARGDPGTVRMIETFGAKQ